MKTTNIFNLTLMAFATLLISCSTATDKGNEEITEEKMSETEIVPSINYAIDPENSTIYWKGEMLGMYAHEGTIDIRESYIATENNQLTGGGFIVNMKSITPTDGNFNPKEGKTKEKLVQHLKSPDFFDVANYPTASFDIIEVGEGTVKGLLSLRDQRYEEVVTDVVVHQEGEIFHLTGTLTFDRQKYNVAYASAMKEMVLSDDITLKLDLKTLAQK